MDLMQIIDILKNAIDLTEIGMKVKEYFLSTPSEFENPNVRNIISNLPADSTLNQIISALTPIYEQKFGLVLKAGDNNGGDLHLKNVNVEAGENQSVIVSGGNGGEFGKGGSTFISNSSFSGGKKFN